MVPMDTDTTIVFFLVVGARFLVPLLIPRFPLPAVLGSLVLDAADQSIFQWFGHDPPGYQGYDKAMDVYYLAIAYLSTLRNWSSEPAYQVSRFLFFYRLAGVTAFELTQWRPLLLIFPNTFEYFFIAYEAIRSRWFPERFGRRFWLRTAGLIWVFVKLPQEYWIHIAKLDFTETVTDVPWFAPLLVVLAIGAGAVFWFVVRPRLRTPDRSFRLAADPVPAGMDTAAERDASTAAHGRVLGMETLEKVVLVGLISVIYGQVLPDLRATNTQLFLGTACLVVVNVALSLAVVRRARSLESALAAFCVRALLNCGLVLLADLLLRPGEGSLNRGNALFFVLLLTLITTLHDRFSPLHRARVAANEHLPAVEAAATA
jgi:hypothetical protein